MLKISEEIATGSFTTIRLDGTLTGEGLIDLKTLLAESSQRPSPTFVIDMAGVAFMTDEAAGELVRFRDHGMQIINCSPFIQTLLESASKNHQTK